MKTSGSALSSTFQWPGGKLPLVATSALAIDAADDQALGQRLLHVPRLVEVLLDHRVADHLVVAREVDRVDVLLERLDDRFRRVHPGVHRVVDAGEFGDVDHPGGVAGDQHAGDREALRQRPVAARGDRLRAPADPFAALDDLGDERVLLEPLQLVVDAEGGVGVVEADDEAEADLVLAHRVDEAAARLLVFGAPAQRPAEGVDDPVERLRDLPDLLHPELPGLRVGAVHVEVVVGGVGEVADRPLGEDGRLGDRRRSRARSCRALRRPCRGRGRRSGRRGRSGPRPGAWSRRSRRGCRRPPLRLSRRGSGPVSRPRACRCPLCGSWAAAASAGTLSSR